VPKHEKSGRSENQNESRPSEKDFKKLLLEMPDVGDESVFRRIRDFPKPIEFD